MNTSQVMIQYLAAAGIRHIFGYPGDPSVEFLEAACMHMLARSMGCDGVDVDSVKALEGALAGPRAKDRPLVVGARIDPGQYAAQF